MTERPDGAEVQESAAGSHIAVLRDRFEIRVDRPLRPFATATADAFTVTDRRQPGQRLFALRCPVDLPARKRVRDVLRGNPAPGLLPILVHGVVDWPGSEQRHQALVYPQPLGGALGDGYGRGGRAMPEGEALRRFVAPMVKCLQGLSERGLTHRAINLDNLFFADEGKTELVLGDCIAAPPGYNQPSVFEPIERAMATPAGRGTGTTADDLYAFGVCLVLLLLGGNPLGQLDDYQTTMAKIERGSYGALCDRQRISPTMTELLRGLLHDDPSGRWSVNDVLQWLAKKPVKLPRRTALIRPAAPFSLAGEPLATLRGLAFAMARNVPAAASVIRDGHVETWLRQRARAEDTASAVTAEVAASAAGQSARMRSDDALVARVAMVIDPPAPIRYQGLSVMPDGLGPALAEAWLRDGNAQAPAGIIGLELPVRWIAAQPKAGAALGVSRRDFAELRAILENTALGYGLERCLYECNPGLSCQSPLVKRYHASTLKGILLALERAAATADDNAVPIDRHVAAFIAARSGHGVDSHLAALADRRPSALPLAMLGLLADLQQRLKCRPLPALARWLGSRMGPVIEIFHRRKTRQDLERQLDALIDKGNLADMYNLLSDGERRLADASGFGAAVAEFAGLAKRVQHLKTHDIEPTARVQERCYGTVATLSLLSSAAAAVLVVLAHLW